MNKPQLHGCTAARLHGFTASRLHGNSGYQGSRRPLALMKTQSVLLRSGLRLFGTSTLRRCLLAGRRLLRGVRTWQR